MADRERLSLLARRDDGAYLVKVPGSPCVLTVADDGDGGLGVWANSPDAAAARGNWRSASGDLPQDVIDAATTFVARPDWCQIED